MLHYFIRAVHERYGFGIPRPRVVIGIPSGVTEVEKRAVHDAALNAGASRKEVLETLLNLAPYSGYPVVQQAVQIAGEEFAKRPE